MPSLMRSCLIVLDVSYGTIDKVKHTRYAVMNVLINAAC